MVLWALATMLTRACARHDTTFRVENARYMDAHIHEADKVRSVGACLPNRAARSGRSQCSTPRRLSRPGPQQCRLFVCHTGAKVLWTELRPTCLHGWVDRLADVEGQRLQHGRHVLCPGRGRLLRQALSVCCQHLWLRGPAWRRCQAVTDSIRYAATAAWDPGETK